METQIVFALLVAVITYLLTLMLGKQFGAWLSSIGTAIVVLPIIFYFTAGVLGMLHADTSTTQAVADSTITNIVNYVSNRLPEIALSDIAGAFVGAVAGSVTKLVASFS